MNYKERFESMHAQFNIAEWNKKNSKIGYKHGTYSCWRKIGCKCKLCVLAQRVYKKQYRKRIGIH